MIQLKRRMAPHMSSGARLCLPDLNAKTHQSLENWSICTLHCIVFEKELA